MIGWMLTYHKLQQISQRLNLRMSELFAESGEPGDVYFTARRSIGRLDLALRVNTPNYEYFYLRTELRKKLMIRLITHIRARTLDEFGALALLWQVEGTVWNHR